MQLGDLSETEIQHILSLRMLSPQQQSVIISAVVLLIQAQARVAEFSEVLTGTFS